MTQSATPRPSLGRFVAVFVLGFTILQTVLHLPWVERSLLEPYLELSARTGSFVLSLLGFGTDASGTSIASDSFAVEVRRGCDGTGAMALFVAGVAAFPASLRARVLGIGSGLAVIVLVNIVRVVSLFWIGDAHPEYFDRAHGEIWQATFVVLGFLLFLSWTSLVTRAPGRGRV